MNLQNRNSLTDIEKKHTVTKGERGWVRSMGLTDTHQYIYGR